jgi:hypothetical protein
VVDESVDRSTFEQITSYNNWPIRRRQSDQRATAADRQALDEGGRAGESGNWA